MMMIPSSILVVNRAQFLKRNSKLNPLYWNILNSVYRKKEQACILIVGKRGSGKSTLSMRIAMDVDYSFYNNDPEKMVRDRVCKDPDAFLDKIETLKPGSACILEEAGVNVGHRDWMKSTNNVIQKVLQMYRYKRIITIFNVPNTKFLDASIRSMIDFIVETKPGVDHRRGVNKCKVGKIVFSQHYNNSYVKYFRVMVNGEVYVKKVFEFQNVPKQYSVAYQNFSKEFKDQMLKRWIEERKLKEDNSRNPLPTDDNIIKLEQAVRDNLSQFLSVRRKNTLVEDKMMYTLNITRKQARLLKYDLEKKLRDEGIIS